MERENLAFSYKDTQYLNFKENGRRATSMTNFSQYVSGEKGGANNVGDENKNYYGKMYVNAILATRS